MKTSTFALGLLISVEAFAAPKSTQVNQSILARLEAKVGKEKDLANFLKGRLSIARKEIGSKDDRVALKKSSYRNS